MDEPTLKERLRQYG